MYFWTQSSLGSAQSSRPLLVWKLWRGAGGSHTAECSGGRPWGPPTPNPCPEQLSPPRLCQPGQVRSLLRDAGAPYLISPGGLGLPRWLPWPVCAFGCWPLPRPQIPHLPRGGQEGWHLHDARLGALAAGLIIVGYEFARKLPGGIGKAAGGWGVSANCGGRDRMSLSHGSDEKARPVICERVTKTQGGRQPTSGCRLGDRSVGGAGGFCLEISLSLSFISVWTLLPFWLFTVGSLLSHLPSGNRVWVRKSFSLWLSGKEPTCQCRKHVRCEFNPWLRNILWKRKWHPTLVFFLPGKCQDRGAWWATVYGVAKESDTT